MILPRHPAAEQKRGLEHPAKAPVSAVEKGAGCTEARPRGLLRVISMPLKHGYYSAKAQEERQRARLLIRKLREQIDRIAQLRGVAQVGAGNESLTNSPET